MARTKASVARDHVARKQRAEDAARRARRIENFRKAARILSPQELAALSPVKRPARAPSQVDEDSETEPEDETFSRPAPTHIIKLSAEACGSGGRYQWRGRLRGGGGDVLLEAVWVRKNFKAYAEHSRTHAHASHVDVGV